MSQWDANDQGFCRTTEKQAETSELDTSIEEWRTILYPVDDTGFTITEIAKSLSVSESTVRRLLKSKIEHGYIRQGYAMREGRKCKVYQLITGEEK